MVAWVVLTTAAAATAEATDALRTFAQWEGWRANSILLNGDWEFSPGDGSERAETSEDASRFQWKAVTLPGSVMEYRDPAAAPTRFGWVRRTFTVSAVQAGGLAVLHWNQITFGAAAYINGRKVGANAPTGPYQVMLPPGALKAGVNSIVLKIAGGAGAPKSKSGHLLVPAGFGDTRQPPTVQGDLWLDFADTAYMKWILALPDVAGSKVRIRVTPTGFERAEGLTLSAQVRSWPDGRQIGQGEASAVLNLDPNGLGGHSFVEVPIPGFKPWTYEEPHLYTAEVSLRRGEQVLDAATIRFGMREIKVVDGHYKLNGRTLRLRGSELVFEWNWGDIIKGKEFDYLVTEAREMSMNAFRTHTMPPVTWKLPEREGSYWLTARTTGLPGRAVLSQRFVRAVRPPEVPAALLTRRLVVLGGDAAADAWFRSHKLQVDQSLDRLVPRQDMVVIWNAAHLTAAEKHQADAVREFAANGGRVIVLATRSWDWTELCDLKVGDTRGSRAFAYPNAKHSMLAGIEPEWLVRWNGLPGTVAAGSLDGPALAAAEKILWVREPKICVAAEVPVASGKGTVLFSQLDVQRHVDRSKPDYDPVAETVLINMLRGTQPKEKR